MASRSTPHFKSMSSNALREMYASGNKPKYKEKAKQELVRRGHALTAE
tara:strand:+ start:2394 stop:2537 length:144 start_codon:yes stop_codon:yes gene_type:complete